MKRIAALSVVVLVGLSFAASAFAVGNCAGKAKKPVTKITQTEAPQPNSGG